MSCVSCAEVAQQLYPKQVMLYNYLIWKEVIVDQLQYIWSVGASVKHIFAETMNEPKQYGTIKHLCMKKHRNKLFIEVFRTERYSSNV